METSPPSSPASAPDDRAPARRSIPITAAAVVAIALIGWLDVLSGPRIGMSLFYLMPIVACGWWGNRRAALVAALAASATWLAADLATEEIGVAVSLWNGLTRLAIYLFVGVSVAVSRRDRRQLAHLLALAESLARTDALTGLANARAFRERLESELPRLARSGEPLCIAYLDLDNFKRVNDRYGHERGDALLREIATELHGGVRAGDLPARLGGDELAVLLVDTTPEGAARICERLIERVRALGAALPGTELGASAGIAWFERAPTDPDEALARADDAMYEAKREGKNRVVVSVADEAKTEEAPSAP